MSVLGFIGQQIASYGFNKGLEKLFSSKEDFATRLNNVISKTIDEFENIHHTPDVNGKYAFYKAKELVTEFLKYRMFAKNGYELNATVIQNSLEVNPNIIKPSIKDIEKFIAVFDRLVSEDEELKKLEIETFHKQVIFDIYSNVEKSLNLLKTHLVEVIPLLEEEYQEEINTYVDELKSLNAKSALSHIDGLQNRVNKNLPHVSNRIQASLYYFKGLCYEALGSSNDAFECFINAHKIASDNIQYLGKACIAYYHLKDDLYIELKQQIDEREKFNEVSWAISTIESDNPISFIQKYVKEIVLNKDYYKRLVFNNLLKGQHVYIPDLFRVLSASNLSRELPEEINYDNLHHWIFVLNSLSMQFFNNRKVNYLGFIEKDERSLKILRLAEVLSSSIIGSELGNSYYAIVFIFFWFQSEIDLKPDTLRKLKDSYNKIDDHDTFRTLLFANSIRKYEGVKSAIEVIDSYEGELDENLISLRTFCILENSQGDDAVLDYFRFVKKMDEQNAMNICGFIFPIGKFEIVKKNVLIEVFKEIEYTKPHYETLVTLMIRTLYREGEVNVNSINMLKDNIKGEFELYFFIALLYYENRHLDECIQFQESYVNEEKESRDLRLYILALNSISTKNQLKLLRLLKKWRKSYSFDKSLLTIEIDLRQILKDWGELLLIAEYGLQYLPEDEAIFTLYIVALSLTDNTDRIIAEIGRIRNFNFNLTDNVLRIANILFQLDFVEDGIEMVYKKAVKKTDSIARVNFFYLSTSLPQEYFKDGQLVEEGYYVKYEVDGKFETIHVNSETMNLQIVQNSIGKKAKESFTLKNKVTNSLKIVRISRIMNKYLALLDEIYLEANSSFSNLPLGAVQFQTTDFKGIEKAFIENFGVAHEESRKQRKNNFERYYKYDISFAELISLNFDGSIIDGFYNLISNQHNGFLIKPIKYFSKIENIENKTLVLDLCSGLLIYEISQKLELNLGKFVVSGNIFPLIDEEIIKTESIKNSGMSITIRDNKVIPHIYPEDFHDRRVEFLVNLKNWFKNNSISIIPEEKLEVVRPLYSDGKMKQQFDYVIDNAILAKRDNYILITDDIIYESRLKIQNWITIEQFLISYFPEKKIDVLIELLKFRYVGISINSEVMYIAYMEQNNAGSSHIYNYALRNLTLPLNFSPYNIFTSIDFLKQLALNPAISHEKYKFEATNLLFMLISGFPKKAYSQILRLRIDQKFELLGEYYDLTLAAFNDAIRISNLS